MPDRRNLEGDREHVLDQVRDEVVRRRDDLVELLADLVAAPSENPPGDERAVTEVLRQRFARSQVRHACLAREAHRPNLVARHGPGEGRTLMLAAHTDTVAAAPGWSHEPFRLTDESGKLFGLGTSDNKGAVAAMAIALTTLVDLDVVTAGRLLLVLNADEEGGSHFGMDYLRDAISDRVDAAIVAEPSGIDADFESLWIETRATLRFQIVFRGTSSHSGLAQRPQVVNAAQTLLDLTPGFIDGLVGPSAPHPIKGSLVPVSIATEGAWGMIPSEARIGFDFRLDPGQSHETIVERLEEAAQLSADHRPGAVTLVLSGGSNGWVASSSVPADAPVVRSVRTAWQRLFGVDPPLRCFPGGTDARALAERGIPAVPGVGPGALCRAHAADEYVTAQALEDACVLYAQAALIYLNGWWS